MLQTSWEVKYAAGEPRASVHVRDLQVNARIGTDAWGRVGKEQPLLLSANLSLASPFHTAASTDCVSDDTVHYGLLAKAFLSSLDNLEKRSNDDGAHITLRQALDYIQDAQYSNSSVQTIKTSILADPGKVRHSCLTMMLPKASLLGSGVSMTKLVSFPSTSAPASWGVGLGIHGLRVPTLIGVNDNERKARQIVVADLQFDKFDCYKDIYNEIESFVVEVCSSDCCSLANRLLIFALLRLDHGTIRLGDP